MACFRTASPGVTIMVAIPRSNNMGVRRLTRLAAGRHAAFIHGERSCSVSTLGRRGI